MTTEQKFAACWEAAARIVSAYRAEAPAGCDPQNSWVVVAVGVIGAGTGVATNMLGGDSKKAALSKVSNLNWGQKPKVAKYEPVDFSAEQLKTIMGNHDALTKGGGDLMKLTNDYIDTDAMTRATRFIPGYKQNIKTLGSATSDLLAGRLPYEDALGIVSDRADLTGAMGIPGSGASATLRDLGMGRLDAIKSGAGLMQGMVQMAEQVNPVGRRTNPQANFLNPTDRIRLTMEQNQLNQQSHQNAYNIEAGISPSAQVANQIALQQAMGGGSSSAGAIGGGVMQGLGLAMGAAGGGGGSGGGGFASMFGGGSGGGQPNAQGFYGTPQGAYSAYSAAGYSPVIVRNPNGAGYYSPYSMPV